MNTALDKDNLPRHIAIIMDGNGRWAKKRMLPVQLGHRAGMEALERVVTAAGEIGIEELTVYAFSTENWKRDQQEVGFLMNLAVEYFKKEIESLIKNNVQVHLIGDRTNIPKKVLDAANKLEEKTKDNTGLVLNVAFNYGGRLDIVQATKRLLESGINPDELTEEVFSDYLYTANSSDPDIIVRTGNEKRLSNFLLWQASYSELIFTDDYWPDCDKEFLERVILEYQNRNRRFGGR